MGAGTGVQSGPGTAGVEVTSKTRTHGSGDDSDYRPFLPLERALLDAGLIRCTGGGGKIGEPMTPHFEFVAEAFAVPAKSLPDHTHYPNGRVSWSEQ